MTDQILEHFMTPRALLCRGVRSDTLLPSIHSKIDPSKGQVKDPNSKSQLRKMKKLEAVNAKKALKAKEKETASIATAGVAALDVTDEGNTLSTI